MIIVDSSVWIDYFNGVRSAETDELLLYSDRDFDPFVEHFGLRSVIPAIE